MNALREAIVRVSEDQDLPEEGMRSGRAYALSLRGEERLADDIVRIVLTKVLGLRRTSEREKSAGITVA